MKTPSQPRAIYYIVAIQIWEYFSFYGMRALLILYLTHQLGFDDNHAISLFSAYASLVYVTPILGGWLADRLALFGQFFTHHHLPVKTTRQANLSAKRAVGNRQPA